MNIALQRRFLNCGPALMLSMLLGLSLFAQWLMPLPATSSIADNARYLTEHSDVKRLGVNLLFLGSIFYIPFSVVIFTQMKRIEGPAALWAYVQFGAGIAAVTEFFFVCVCFQTALYRVGDQSPETARLLMDLGWMMFVLGFPAFMLQLAAVGFCILGDRRPAPLYPRWSGYVALFVGFTMVVDLAMPYFKTGALARDGMLGYWFVLITFGIWVAVIYVTMRKALAVQAAEEAGQA